MSRKKLLTSAIGIVIMASLVGTSIATDGRSPFELIWQAIHDLQARVTSLEESTNTQSKIKAIRFYEPDETMNDQQTYVDGAVFVWTPNNGTDNAILSINCYFQYRCESYWGFRIAVNNEDTMRFSYDSSSVYTWSKIVVYPMHYVDFSISPNQNSYTLKFQLESFSNEFPVYVKDINIIITVADGLPPSN